jgi:hypothetical protein
MVTMSSFIIEEESGRYTPSMVVRHSYNGFRTGSFDGTMSAAEREAWFSWGLTAPVSLAGNMPR